MKNVADIDNIEVSSAQALDASGSETVAHASDDSVEQAYDGSGSEQGDAEDFDNERERIAGFQPDGLADATVVHEESGWKGADPGAVNPGAHGSPSDVHLDQDAAGINEDHGKINHEASFDIPRPFLTLEQAAAFLGKSIRAIERAILGKWGNKLPQGWSAKKIPTGRGLEWRIIPPPGFRLRQPGAGSQKDSGGTASSAEALAGERKQGWLQSVDHPSIIIDRSEEVEYLLRELVMSQKQVSEERRLRMEDLRLITQMQTSMRLLEVRASETSQLKSELSVAQQELRSLKEQYLELLNMPWWKRLFRGR